MGPYFTKNGSLLGPYLKAWESLLGLETVPAVHMLDLTMPSNSRSFVVSGGSAVYVAAYSVFYFVTKLEIDEFVPTLLYFSYTVIFYSRKKVGIHTTFAGDHGRDLLAVDGHHWILRCLHFHPQNLRGGQDRLSVN